MHLKPFLQFIPPKSIRPTYFRKILGKLVGHFMDFPRENVRVAHPTVHGVRHGPTSKRTTRVGTGFQQV